MSDLLYLFQIAHRREFRSAVEKPPQLYDHVARPIRLPLAQVRPILFTIAYFAFPFRTYCSSVWECTALPSPFSLEKCTFMRTVTSLPAYSHL